MGADNSFRLFLEKIPEAAAVLGAGGKIVDANKALAKLLGTTPARLAGAPFRSFVAADHRKAFDAMAKSRSAGAIRKKGVLDPGGGELIPVFLSARPVPVKTGTGKCIVVTDLRGLRERPQEIREVERTAFAEQQRLYQVLETLPAYVVLLSPDYFVPFANKFFRDRFGESRGKRCFEYLFGRSEPCEDCETFKVLRTGKRHQWEWAGPDGRTYDVHDYPFRDWDGSRLILEMGIDITEQKRAEAALRQSSGYVRSLIEAALDPLVTISAEGTITDVNKATIDATGLPRDRLVGTDFSSYFTEPEKARAGYRRVFAEGSVTDYPLTLRRADGKTMDVLYNATVYRNESGKVLGVFAAARDVTQQKQAQEAQRRASQYARSLIEASLDPLVTISPEGRITDVNEATIRATGVSREKLVGTDFSSYFTEPQKAQAGYRQVFAAGSVTDYPLTLRGVDGTTRDVLYNATVYRDESGAVAGVFAAARDVTLRKRAEEELKRHRDHLEELVRERTREIEETTARLQTTVDSLAEGLIVSDLSGNVLQLNPAALAMYGFSDTLESHRSLGHFQEIIELSTEQGVLPRDEWPLARVLRGETFSDLELRVRRRDKDWSRVFKYGGSLARDKDGRPLLGLITVVDVTERKATQERLAHLASFPEQNPNPILEISPGGTVVFLNPAARQALRDLNAEDTPDILVPEDFEAIVEELKVPGGRGIFREVKAGGAWFLVSLFPSPGFETVRLYAMDITQRKQAEEKVIHSNELLQQYAYVASHDLQEPLRIIASYSQLLEKRYKARLDRDADDFIEYIVDGANRMQKLITDLLEYSRAGVKDTQWERVDARSVLEKVTASLAPAIEESGGKIVRGELPVITVPEVGFTQILQNLIANGIKFHGAAPPEIVVTAEEHASEWIVSVSDNGIGIEPEYLERIFQIFQRLHSREEYPGTGIGLSICKKIVEHWGGRMWAESEPGKGSTFRFTVPKKGE